MAGGDQRIGWHSNTQQPLVSYKQPGEVKLTSSQRATVFFFLIIAVLFLMQALLGALTEHYRADLSSFFGLNLNALLPYNLARTWHVQLSLFWTAASFLAAGIFITPFITRREPSRQHWLAHALLGALAVVVFGSLISEGLSTFGIIKEGTLFSQQWEYLDLPGSGKSCWSSGCSSGSSSCGAGCAPRWELGQDGHAVAVLPGRPGHPGLLRGRPAGQQ